MHVDYLRIDFDAAGFRNTEASLIFAAFILFVFSCLKVASANRTTLYADEVRGLSELPMSELMHIRSSLADEEGEFAKM